MIDVRQKLKRAGVVAMLLFAIGCSAKAPLQDQFYRLEPVVKIEPKNQVLTTGTILVTQLSARGFAGGTRIVFRDNRDQLQVQRYRYRLWAQPPVTMIQDAIVQALRAKHVAEYVITPAERANASWILSGTLFRIEYLREANQVNIELELGLINAQNRKTIFQRRYSQIQTVDGASMAHVVAAFNDALAQMIGVSVNDLTAVLADCAQRESACR